jgi:23S rRNA (pseudouridine1915-N3)-methyltransferase
MRLMVLAVGRLKDGPERDLAERYRERATQSGRALGFTGPESIEFAESRARRPEDRKAEEAMAFSARIPAGWRVALDERGPVIGSERFAALLAAARDGGRAHGTFIIGGADGLGEEVRQTSDLVLSFGALTLPHQLARVLVFEQLYRAMTIIAGHPYHRT